MSVAVAVFVKTPALSPIKTRLAAAIGPEAALALYRASIDCVRAAIDASTLSPFWAVAEAAGATHWSDWPVLLQPEGDLGARMRGIYQQLIQHHSAVLLVGADVPALGADLLEAAATGLRGAERRVIAPARDGGFVLFGANVDLGQAAWSAVDYGNPGTAAAFLSQVGADLPLLRLAEQQDLDTVDDLRALIAQPPAVPNTAQRAFWQLAQSLLAQPSRRPKP